MPCHNENVKKSEMPVCAFFFIRMKTKSNKAKKSSERIQNHKLNPLKSKTQTNKIKRKTAANQQQQQRTGPFSHSGKCCFGLAGEDKQRIKRLRKNGDLFLPLRCSLCHEMSWLPFAYQCTSIFSIHIEHFLSSLGNLLIFHPNPNIKFNE